MASNQLGQETIDSGEQRYFESLVHRLENNLKKEYPSGMMRRGAHPKLHGLVKAELTIESGLPQQLQIGLFKIGGSYPAWIRFSNQRAQMQPDSTPDIRGMAIKLMNVPGKKLLESSSDASTHDFVTISSKAFICRNPREFDALVKALMAGKLARLWFLATHWHVAKILSRSNKKISNPLQIAYYSTTPYLFGNTAVKYAIVPSDISQGADALHGADPDYLRAAMRQQLANGDAVFDFMLQLQTDAERMPIEDPSVPWCEQASPFRKVATIRIPAQEFDTEQRRQYSETLSFNPWHCLPEHRPLGGVNRVRKVLYDALSGFRHQKNGVTKKEPEGFEI